MFFNKYRIGDPDVLNRLAIGKLVMTFAAMSIQYRVFLIAAFSSGTPRIISGFSSMIMLNNPLSAQMMYWSL
jgi:hypothetical protein